MATLQNVTLELNNGDVPELGEATDSVLGIVKTNSAEGVALNSDGQLQVNGRLGQVSGGTGLYSPNTISPSLVGNGSLLLTEGTGTRLGTKSLAISTGIGITLRTAAAAGATEYRVQNTYLNRISCAILAVNGGVIAQTESSAATTTVRVTSVQINGENYTPDSSANNSSSSNDIVIKTAESINPNSSISSIRAYPAELGFSNLYVGQGVGGADGTGASIIAGQRVARAGGNANVLVGADIYNSGNGNAVFGRQHISRKNRSFLAGTGHDTTNATGESVAAVGEWSNITSTTAFAVGNGTSHTARKNAFEVTSDGGVVLASPNGTRYKITVSNDGTLTTATA